MTKLKQYIRAAVRRLFGWDRSTLILFLGFWVSFICFDVMWCLWSTFNPFSHLPLYVGSIGFSLLFTLPYVVWRRRWPCYVLLGLLELLFVANLMYARTYMEAIPLSSYAIADNLADFMPSVRASLRVADLLFLVLPIGVVVLCRRLGGDSERRTSRVGFLCLTAVPVLCFVVSWPTPESFKQMYADYARGAYSYRSGPVAYTLFGKLYYDALTGRETLSDADRAATMAAIASRPPVPALPEGVKPRRNVVVVMCESLESWPIGLTYEGHEVTPRLNALLRDSTTLYAPYILSQAKGGRSMDGQLLIFTGLLPVEQGAYSTTYPHSSFPSLHKAMKTDRGSRSFLFTGDKIKVWNQEGVAGHLGLDTLISYPDFRVEDSFRSRKHVGDIPFMRQVVEKLESGTTWQPGTPGLLQIITYSGHHPFLMDESKHRFTLSGKAPEMMERYIYVTAYVDEALGILLDYLQSRPDWEDTLVVLTGDHEGLGDTRTEILRSPLSAGIVPEEQMVPLIIVNSPVGGRIPFMGGQSDIYPTLLQLLGLQGYRWPGFGTSLLSPEHPHAALDPYGGVHQAPGASADSLPDAATLRRMRRAWTHADRILKHDLMADY